jgi:hypothetical protein
VLTESLLGWWLGGNLFFVDGFCIGCHAADGKLYVERGGEHPVGVMEQLARFISIYHQDYPYKV